METSIKTIKDMLEHVNMSCVGNRTFNLRVERDPIPRATGRIFIQVKYKAPCVKTGETKLFKGRKWYLSDHMTQDEIYKTAYSAFEAAILHEVKEGFWIDGISLFNPHTCYRELLKASLKEVKRQEPKQEVDHAII